MALSRSEYTGDGETTQFSVTFPYLDQDHVSVSVNGDEVSFEWLNSGTVVLDETPESGSFVQIARNTPSSEQLVTFANGSWLEEGSLNTSALQNFYVAQEVLDMTSNTIGLDEGNQYDADGKQLRNVGEPTAATDAVRLAEFATYTDEFDSKIDEAETQKQLAQSAAASAAASATDSATHSGASETAKDAASAAAATAGVAADAAEVSHSETVTLAASLAPPGSIHATVRTGSHDGWLLLNGSTLGDIGSGGTWEGDDYSTLYLILWESLPQSAAQVSGGGRGISALSDWEAGKTIKLPDARGLTIIGTGLGSGLTDRSHGSTGGTETHVLTEAEMPRHSHDFPSTEDEDNSGAVVLGSAGSTFQTNETGDDQPHNNMQPYLALNYVIKT